MLLMSHTPMAHCFMSTIESHSWRAAQWSRGSWHRGRVAHQQHELLTEDHVGVRIVRAHACPDGQSRTTREVKVNCAMCVEVLPMPE